MSRIGKKPLTIPAGVDVKIESSVDAQGKTGSTVRVKGPKAELARVLPKSVSIAVENGVLSVHVADPESVEQRALWGLVRRLVENMVEGVTKGFAKKLEVNGIGFKVAASGDTLTLDVGFSHDVKFHVPADISVTVEKNVITVSGADKERVGQVAAEIRSIKKPEPYKGKGIKYSDETLRRKAAKAGSAA